MTTEQKIEARQKQIDELKASLKNDAWPKVDDDYYVLMPNGRIDGYQWDNDGTDLEYKKRGNIYRTEEETKRADDRRILIAEIREFAGYYKPVWDETIEQMAARDAARGSPDEGNFAITYSVERKRWEAIKVTTFDSIPLCGYFGDRFKALDAIEKFKDRLHLLREV
jgi:hypothetical protein